MKTRELSLGEKQAILKLRGEIDQSHCTSIGDSLYKNLEWLEKEETTGVLSNRHRTGQPKKTTAVDDKNIVRNCEEKPKTSVSDITNNLHRAGMKVSHSTIQKRLGAAI